jgi:hypothetical protein
VINPLPIVAPRDQHEQYQEIQQIQDNNQSRTQVYSLPAIRERNERTVSLQELKRSSLELRGEGHDKRIPRRPFYLKGNGAVPASNSELIAGKKSSIIYNYCLRESESRALQRAKTKLGHHN